MVLERQERGHVAVGDEPDVATLAAVAAVRAALGHVGLAPDRDTSGAAVAASHIDLTLVDEAGHDAAAYGVPGPVPRVGSGPRRPPLLHEVDGITEQRDGPDRAVGRRTAGEVVLHRPPAVGGAGVVGGDRDRDPQPLVVVDARAAATVQGRDGAVRAGVGSGGGGGGAPPGGERNCMVKPLQPLPQLPSPGSKRSMTRLLPAYSALMLAR